MRARLKFFLVFLTTLSACGAQADLQGWRPVVELGPSPRGPMVPALDGVLEQALGVPVSSRALLDGGVVYQTSRNRYAAVRLEKTQEITPGLQRYTQIELSQGYSRYHLPQGLSVLTYPTDIDFRTNSLTPEIGFRVPVLGPTQSLQATISAGLGYRLSATHTQMRSGSLDLSEHMSSGLGYASFAVDFSTKNLPGSLQLESVVQDARSVGFRANYQLPLMRGPKPY